MLNKLALQCNMLATVIMLDFCIHLPCHKTSGTSASELDLACNGTDEPHRCVHLLRLIGSKDQTQFREILANNLLDLLGQYLKILKENKRIKDELIESSQVLKCKTNAGR